MAEITSAELRELELRRSQDDLKTLLGWLREDGEIVVVDEDEDSDAEPADNESGEPSDNPSDISAEALEPVFA